jgi:ketosteroid isomerase-like protein
MANNGERAVALVRALEASVAGDSSVVAELFTDDVHGWAPIATVSSAAELAVELEDRGDAFSDVELAVSPLDVGGDCAAVEWIATVTHSGRLELRDTVIDPTGARVRLHGVTVAEFVGDRICSFRQYWDEVELLEQLELVADDCRDSDD